MYNNCNMHIDVNRVGSAQIVIETGEDSTSGRFVYNPETGYVLLPASVYGSLSGSQLQEIKSHSAISGVFNHEKVHDLS